MVRSSDWAWVTLTPGASRPNKTALRLFRDVR